MPDAKKKGGTAGQSSDLSARGSCSWNGLDDKGLKGSQYRWLDVGLTRFDSDQALGSGAERATADYTKQIAKTKAAEGATKVAAEATAGIGEEATVVTYGLSKTDEDFEYATVVARTGNVVVTLTYNGAGFAGGKKPSSAEMVEGAQKAVKEAIGAVEKTAEATPPAKGEDKDADKGTEKAGDDGKKDSGFPGTRTPPRRRPRPRPSRDLTAPRIAKPQVRPARWRARPPRGPGFPPPPRNETRTHVPGCAIAGRLRFG